MIDIVAPVRQHSWKWPAVLNFFLGGSAAGLFLHLFWSHTVLGNPSMDQIISCMFVIPAVMAAMGLAVLSTEAGRPLRAVYLGHHLARSWMSKEALFGMLFIFLSIFYALTLTPKAAYAAAFFALLFMLSQGFILARSRSLTIWNTNKMPLLFLLSGICSGYALWLLLRVCPQFKPGSLWINWGACIVLLNFLAWMGFFRSQRRKNGRKMVPFLGKKDMGILVLDGVVPLTALMGIYFSGLAASQAKFWVTALGSCCGASLWLAGLYKLHYLLHEASFMRPVTANLTGYPPKIEGYKEPS